ncbi:MAG: translocation/assembly module TamB domain-containing protein [Planctomycetota bacterium]
MRPRLIVKGAVLSGILLLSTHVLRKPLFESLLIGLLEGMVGEQLAGDIEIAALDGDWLSGISIQGLELHGGRGTLRSVRDGRILLGYSLVDLLLGKQEGLRSAELRARRITVVSGSHGGSGGSGVAGLDWSSLEGIVPGGLEMSVDELQIGVGEAARRAPLRVKLLPIASPRSLTLDYEDLHLSVQLAGGGVRARLDAGSPGALARAMGLEQPIRGGNLALDLSLETPDGVARLTGQGRLEGASLGSGRIRRASFAFSMAPDRLDVPEIDIRLPGLTLRGKGLSVPLASLRNREMLEQLEGEIDLDVENLEPYRSWLGETAPELLPHLPLRGRLRGSLGEGKLEISDCRFQGAGFELDSSGGELPLSLDFLGGSGSGRIDFELRLPKPRPLEVAGLEAIPWSARLKGTVEGSLRQPKVQAELVLDSGSSTHLSGSVGYVPDSRELGYRLSGRLDPRGLVPGGEVHGLSPVEVVVDGKAALPERGHVHGRAALRLSGVHLGRKLELNGKLELNELGELVSDELELIAKGDDGTDRVLVEAEGRVPVLGGDTIEIRAHATELPLAVLSSVPGLPPGLLGEGSLEMVVMGPLKDPEIRGALRARVESGMLGELWPAKFLGEAPGRQYRLRLGLGGRLSALSIEELALSGGTENRSFRLACAGELPLRFALDGTVSERRIPAPLTGSLAIDGRAAASLYADFSVEHDRMAVERLECRLGPAAATGRLELTIPLAEVCQRPESIGNAGLSGRLEIRRFSLAGVSVPGLEDLNGRLAGTARVEGTLAAPKPRVDLDVSNAELKMAGVPRIENLEARLRVLPSRIEILRLRGRVGAGDLQADLSLDTHDRLLWEAYDSGTVQVSLHGEDVLLARTADLKLRGSLDLEATGTAEDIRIRGQVDLVSGKYARRVSALPDFALRGGTQPDSGFSPFRMTSALGRRISFDNVEIKTRKPFRLRTQLIDCDLDGALTLSGAAVMPYFVGTVSGSRGTLRLPGVTLEIVSILLGFEPSRPYHPVILMKASGRRLGYRIQLTVTGPGHQPEVLLTSAPPLPPEDLLVLVSTGYTPGLLRANKPQDNLTLLGTYLLSELYSSITGGGGTEDEESAIFDRITIEAGRDIGSKGVESVRVELGLSDKFYLVLERDIYGDYNVRPGFRIRF